MSPTVAYLINQYPLVSLTFIRREIAAVEAKGLKVLRYAIRPTRMKLVDKADVDERDRTRAILDVGVMGLVGAGMATFAAHPLRFIKALAIAFGLGRRSDRGVARHLAYLAEACVLRRWLARANVQHLHVHFATNSTTVALLCRALGGPDFSFTMHGSACFDKLATIGLEQKVDACKFVVAISQFGCSQIYRYIPHAQWDKVRLIRCGVDEAFVDFSPQPVADRPRLVTIGRLVEQKGQLILIDAAAKLKQQHIQFELVIVGDGPMRGSLEQAIRERGLEDHVRLAGWADNAQVRRHLQDAQALVLPSFTEGLPVVIMEALAMGRPVISTFVAGIPELVKPGVNGWLIPAGSVDALAHAMQQVIEMDADKLSAMGTAGRETVLQQHDAACEADKLVQLFRASITADRAVDNPAPADDLMTHGKAVQP